MKKKLLLYKLFFKKLRLIFIFIAILSFLSIGKVYGQKCIIFGIKYTPYMNFSKFEDKQYVSHAWDLNASYMTKWKTASEFPFIRIDNISLTKKINISIEVGRSHIGIGYRRTINGNYLSGEKWKSKLIGTDLCSFTAYPINLYFFSKLTNKRCRKYFKIGGTIIDNKNEFTTMSISNYVYPDAKAAYQDTFTEISISSVKPFTKLTLNLGIGIEKTFWHRIILDLGLVYNQGFSTIRTTDVEYSIDGMIFKNRILNKGSYLGLELNIGFNVFNKEKK